MAEVPTHLRYTKEHEWLELDGENATIGITDYAQTSLGDLVFVELPEVGTELSINDEFAVVESVKAASEVYAPASGEVTAINTELNDAPALINEQPYTDGWLAKIKLFDTSELEETMTAEEYETYIQELEA